MTTNGILLDKHIDFLANNDIMITVSLDGNENHNSYRLDSYGKSSFPQLYQNLKVIKDMYPEYFKRKVTFNAVLHDRNSVAEICEFFEAEYNVIPNISQINTVGIQEEKMGEFNKLFRSYIDDLKKVTNPKNINDKLFLKSPDIQSVSNFLIQHSGNYFKSYDDLVATNNDKNFIPTGTCLPFGRKMFITAAGKIFPCERIGHQYAIGKVSDAGIDLDTAQIAKLYNEYYEKIERQCSTCYNAESCFVCMFNIQGLNRERPICNEYTNLHSLKRRFSEIFSTLEENSELYRTIISDVVIE